MSRDPMELVGRLEKLSALEAGWYANVGKRTGEQCCAAMSEAAACIREMVEWQPIETAPKDGTVIVAWGKPCPSATEGPYVSSWAAYGHGSMARELWLRGEGPEGRFWHVEPVSNWTNSWDPTHWLPLPSAPNQAKEAGQ